MWCWCYASRDGSWPRLSIANSLYYQVSTAWVTWPASTSESHYLSVFGKSTSRWHQQSFWYSVWWHKSRLQLASAVHPKFKLDWVENQVQKSLVVEQLKRAFEIEHRSKETQQDCPTAFARESHQDQTHVTAATPPAKDFFARITSKRNATVARPMQMLRWNHIFQILLPNCRAWKPIQISAKFTWSWIPGYQPVPL